MLRLETARHNARSRKSVRVFVSVGTKTVQGINHLPELNVSEDSLAIKSPWSATGSALSFTRSLLLRWRLGERRSLWDEAIMAVECRPLSGAKPLSRKDVCADAGRLVALGRPGQALKRLTSPGLARDTPEVQAKLMAKVSASSCDRLRAKCVAANLRNPRSYLTEGPSVFSSWIGTRA